MQIKYNILKSEIRIKLVKRFVAQKYKYSSYMPSDLCNGVLRSRSTIS